MKKRLVALLLCVTVVLSMTACGDSAKDAVDNTEGTEDISTEIPMPTADLAKHQYQYSDYVTLCDYSAIPVELSESYETTDADVEAYIQSIMEYYGPFYTADETKTVVAEGDIVNVDYVGKLDGEAFSGGSAEDQLLDVSGNCSVDGSAFIDGFTTGILGAEVGTEVDCDVTFPEEYHNADLAGKAVVFTFTVNSIQKEVTYEEMDDAFVLSNFGAESVAEFYTSIRDGLTEENEYYKMQDGNADIQQYLIDNCEVDIPADYLADLLVAYRNMFIWQYCDSDETQLEEYLSTNYGYTLEETEEEWNEYFTQLIKLEFILGAIADEMGLELDQEAYEESIADYMEYYGLDSAEPVYQSYGYGDVVYGEAQVKNMHVQSDLLEKLMETAIVTIAEPAE